MILAQTSAFMGVESSLLIGVVTALGVLFGLWQKVNKAKADIVAELKKELRLEAADNEEGKERTVGPQPFRIAMEEDFVKRSSYETHCRLNREAHAKIEETLKNEIAKVSELHRQLFREVGEINVRSESNEQRLIQMDTKLDTIRRDIHSAKEDK